jgi:hypothetical protein
MAGLDPILHEQTVPQDPIIPQAERATQNRCAADGVTGGPLPGAVPAARERCRLAY